jgi:hypothetical protein
MCFSQFGGRFGSAWHACDDNRDEREPVSIAAGLYVIWFGLVGRDRNARGGRLADAFKSGETVCEVVGHRAAPCSSFDRRSS